MKRGGDHIKIKGEETSRTKLKGETTTTRKGEAKGSVDQNKIDARSERSGEDEFERGKLRRYNRKRKVET